MVQMHLHRLVVPVIHIIFGFAVRLGLYATKNRIDAGRHVSN